MVHLRPNPHHTHLVWWPGFKSDEYCLVCVGFSFNDIRGSLALVQQVGVKDIKLVALYDLGWWIVRVIMRLVVLVPFVAGVDAIEVSRFAGTIFILPHVRLSRSREIRWI